jgi:hypothetical protein
MAESLKRNKASEKDWAPACKPYDTARAL